MCCYISRSAIAGEMYCEALRLCVCVCVFVCVFVCVCLSGYAFLPCWMDFFETQYTCWGYHLVVHAEFFFFLIGGSWAHRGHFFFKNRAFSM